MIERNTFGFTATCDSCPSGCEDIDEENFYSAIDELKKRGWKIFKRRGDWNHTCTMCAEESEFED